jgi:hypothetical protein
LANSGDFPEKITLMSSSYTVSYYTSFTAKPEEPLAFQLKPIKILIISDDQCYTSEQQFFPLFSHRKQLRQRFRLALNHLLIKDVLKFPDSLIKKYDLILIKISFKTPVYQVKSILNRLYTTKGNAKLVYFDGDDDACIQWPDILNYVDLYVKKSLFVDLKQYEKVFIGKNNLTDYVAHNYNVSFSDNIIPKSNPINLLLIEKIFLGCNIALDDKIQKLYQEGLGNPEILKDNDILCRLTIPDDWMGNLRKDITSQLQKISSQHKILIPDKRVPIEQYCNELSRSKISVSPFGYGEICWRDFESILFQCLLIKPDMSHIKTFPDIFVPYKTYVPIKWDFSDLNEKCLYYLKHEDERKSIISQASKVLYEFYQNEKFIDNFGDLLQKLGFNM